MSLKVAALGECMLELSAIQLSSSDQPLSPVNGSIGYGGDTLNTAIYLSRLGVDCHYITALGDDPYSQWMVSHWEAEGIDVSGVKIIPDSLPGVYAIQLDDNGERCFHYWREQSAVKKLFCGADARSDFRQLLEGIDYLYLSGITLSLFSDEEREYIFKTLHDFREGGGKVVFDCNYRARGWKNSQIALKAFEEIYPLTDIALPTMGDMVELKPTLSLNALIEEYREAGIQEIVIKQGSGGCTVYSHEETKEIPATTVKNIVDTTAAGDSFNAAYLAARVSGIEPDEAAGFANQIAGKVIQFNGAIINRNEIAPYKKLLQVYRHRP